jgi:hypothetical protein
VTLGPIRRRGRSPGSRRDAAARAVLDTIGVALAGASEPAARAVQRVVTDSQGPCTILGLATSASPGDAALANGTAAHALDYDDMCFVSLAHPSAPLVAAALAAAEAAGASGRSLLDAYVVGLRDRSAAGTRDEPATLPARLALHVDARHDRRRRRGGAAARSG